MKTTKIVKRILGYMMEQFGNITLDEIVTPVYYVGKDYSKKAIGMLNLKGYWQELANNQWVENTDIENVNMYIMFDGNVIHKIVFFEEGLQYLSQGGFDLIVSEENRVFDLNDEFWLSEGASNYLLKALEDGMDWEDIEQETFIMREISINGEFRGMRTPEDAREAILASKQSA